MNALDPAGLLKPAQPAYRTDSPPGPRIQERADPHLDSFVRLCLDDPVAASLLCSAAVRLGRYGETNAAATTILEEAMALTGAELGNVQIAEPGGELNIVAHSGFGEEFLSHFAAVADDTSVCGRAATRHAQVVITDVEADPAFAPHRAVAAASKFRAVQSTPLVDADGNLVGVVSTHFPRPYRPTERALLLTRLYGLFAGEALVRVLGRRDTSRRGHSDGLASDGLASDGSAPRSSPIATGTTGIDLTDRIVRSLLSAGLSLADARTLLDADAAERVSAAVDELDHALGDVRSVALELHS